MNVRPPCADSGEAPAIACSGRWVRVACFRDEVWRAAVPTGDSAERAAELARLRFRADLFTFSQALPDTTPRFSYHREWDELAVIPVTGYAAWWAALPHATRTNVRKAERSGIETRLVQPDLEMARAVKAIYDETPFRHGRRFRHFGRSLAAVEAGLTTYTDRSAFIGAYLGGRLIGFAKVVVVGATARLMQLLSLEAEREKRPNNALLAEAVRLSAGRRLCQLVYDQYIYHGCADSLTEFKRRNGFVPVPVPRYYIPLSSVGKIALLFGVQRGFSGCAPRLAITWARRARGLTLAVRRQFRPLA